MTCMSVAILVIQSPFFLLFPFLFKDDVNKSSSTFGWRFIQGFKTPTFQRTVFQLLCLHCMTLLQPKRCT